MIEHYWKNDEIFGENWFTYPNLYENVVKEFKDKDTFVEVGSWKGRSSCFLAVEIANSNKNINFYCVDTWEGSVEHQDRDDLHQLYDIFTSNMHKVEEYYTPLRMTSLEASKKFEDKSLSFVFLDASHEYEDVKDDIKSWLPKIKPGGILAGHDYYPDDCYDWFPGVKRAVNEELSNFQTQDNCWIYRVAQEISSSEKLKNFPPVHFISIEESEDRRELLNKKFSEYGITNITPHIFKRYEDSEHTFVSNRPEIINLEEESSWRWGGPLTSHLKAIKEWYFNTDESYAFFCEDDLSLETVEYWNFTWEEFFNTLPSNWSCVQLSWVRENIFGFSDSQISLRSRCWCDWSACAYLITRSHAKKLIANYYMNGEFFIDYVGRDVNLRDKWALFPTAETIVFTLFDSEDSNVYGYPLFVEDVTNCQSSFGGIGIFNSSSYNTVMEWWKTIGKNLTIRQIELK
jgi:GR25 family glycosyltransferase involved in LPS biosynthesis